MGTTDAAQPHVGDARGCDLGRGRRRNGPHLEVKVVDDRFDRASLRNRLTATVGGAALPIGPLELQIAYKLWMGSQTDFEDALQLFDLFEESLSTTDLEDWVETLGVEDAYDRLKRA